MATPSTLRPLSIGEILDAGVKVLTRYWKTLAGLTVGLVLPIEIIYALILASSNPDQFKLLPDTHRTSTEIDWGPLVGLFSGALVISVLFLLVHAVCFKAVADAWLGVEPKAGRSLKFGLKRFPMLLTLWLVWTPAIIVGLLPLFTLALWLAVIWCLSIPALLFERGGPFKALGRSYSLVRGRFWATALLLLVAYVGLSIASGIVQFLLLGIASVSTHDSQLAGGIAQVVGGTITSAVTLPYLCAVLTILYFDQRVRKEGFDLQLMAEGLGTVRDPDAPLPEPLIGQLPVPSRPAIPQSWQPPPEWGRPPPGWRPYGAPPDWQWQPPPSYGGFAPPAPGRPPAVPPAPEDEHDGPWTPPSHE